MITNEMLYTVRLRQQALACQQKRERQSVIITVCGVAILAVIIAATAILWGA